MNPRKLADEIFAHFSQLSYWRAICPNAIDHRSSCRNSTDGECNCSGPLSRDTLAVLRERANNFATGWADRVGEEPRCRKNLTQTKQPSTP